MDAHLDIWDSYFGSKYTHGSFAIRAVDERVIDPERSLQVGIRGPLFGPKDLQRNRDWGWDILFAEDVHTNGSAAVMAVIGLIRFIDAFKLFDTVFILTGGGPGSTTESVNLFTYKMVFDWWEIGPATATAVIIWVMFFIFCYVFYQVAKKKLKAF